jgi:hypothetical protein
MDRNSEADESHAADSAGEDSAGGSLHHHHRHSHHHHHSSKSPSFEPLGKVSKSSHKIKKGNKKKHK